MIEISKTARGLAKPATEEDISKEVVKYSLSSDIGLILTSDSGLDIIPNATYYGYTHPNLHRRIDLDPVVDPEKDYPFLPRNEEGVPYKQDIKLGVWDGLHSYRTTTIYTHDEESTTCEIP